MKGQMFSNLFIFPAVTSSKPAIYSQMRRKSLYDFIEEDENGNIASAMNKLSKKFFQKVR